MGIFLPKCQEGKMADIIKNTLWAVVLVLVLSLAMDVAGITLADDYDGAQVRAELNCHARGGKLTAKPNGTFFQTELTCEEQNETALLHH